MLKGISSCRLDSALSGRFSSAVANPKSTARPPEDAIPILKSLLIQMPAECGRRGQVSMLTQN